MPAIVLTGGDPVEPQLAADLPRRALVIAADSGLEHAASLGLHVDVVIGDMDSVRPDLLASAQSNGATIERHPTDKDATDLELALDYAAQQGHREVIVLGGRGGSRLDHFLGNALALAAPAFKDLDVEWRLGHTVVRVVRTSVTITGSKSDIVSLLPLGGAATGVTTDGLRWPLHHDVLSPGTTRGISNEMLDTTATVALDAGVLLVIHQEGQE